MIENLDEIRDFEEIPNNKLKIESGNCVICGFHFIGTGFECESCRNQKEQIEDV